MSSHPPDMIMRHAARYFDGLSAESRAASAWVDAAGVWVAREGGDAQCWPFAEVVLMRGGGREPVQLERRSTPVEVIVVEQPAFFGELQSHLPRGTRLAGSGGGLPGWKGLVALALAAVLGLFALYRFGIPLVADYAAERVPRQWEQEYGAKVVGDIVPVASRVLDNDVTVPVRTMYLDLARAGGIETSPGQIVVWNEPMPNAFALPGEIVVVTTGLLQIMDERDELRAVIAHEVAHLRRRHVVRSVMRRMGVGLLLGLVAGDQSALSGGLRTAGGLANLANSREYELEADDDAVQLLGAVGTHPEALASALEKLKRAAGAKGLPDFFSTHPDPDARIARLKHAPLPRMGEPREWPAEQQWRVLKSKVGPHRDEQ